MQQSQPLLQVPWTAGKIFQVAVCLTVIMADKKAQDIAVSKSPRPPMTAGTVPDTRCFPGYPQAGAVHLPMHVSHVFHGRNMTKPGDNAGDVPMAAGILGSGLLCAAQQSGPFGPGERRSFGARAGTRLGHIASS